MIQLFIKLIISYQKFISPILKQLVGVRSFCIHPQTCSSYAIASIKKYGALHGLVFAIKRVLSCNSLGVFSFNINSLINSMKIKN